MEKWKNDSGKKWEAGQKETPGERKQRQNTIRCNTDPQATTRRKRREKKEMSKRTNRKMKEIKNQNTQRWQ